jgi:hypothetical protein
MQSELNRLGAEVARHKAEKINFEDQKAQIDSLIAALNESEDNRRAL